MCLFMEHEEVTFLQCEWKQDDRVAPGASLPVSRWVAE